MAQEERLQILQMVADKKITASEAAELLRALDAGKAAPSAVSVAPPAPPAAPTPPTPPERPAALISPSPASGLGSLIGEIVERVTSAFSDVVEPRYEWNDEVTGEFNGHEVPLRIMTGNGRIEVRAWEQPGYKATITVKAPGSSEADARSRARDAYTVDASPRGFTLESRQRGWSGVAVHVTLQVPRDKRYRLETRSGNGQMKVDGLTISEGTLTTGNGTVACVGARADRLRLRSGNGLIDMEGDVGDVEADSGNGSVSLRPTGAGARSIRARTGNGSIHINTRQMPAGTGFRIDANTGMGGAEVSVPNLVYEREVRTVGHKQIIARSTNYEQAAVRVEIQARTGLGSVTVE